MKPRKTDVNDKKLNRFVRNSRFKETAEGWFFITREGLSLGPYETMFDAELSASLLVTRLAQLEKGLDPKHVIQEYLNDPGNPIKRNIRTSNPIDLHQLRRRQRKNARAAVVQKAWSAITSFASVQRLPR